MAIGVALAAAGTRRALFVVALVPVAFAPFAYARLRLHRALAGVLAARRMALDHGAWAWCSTSVMVAQLLTARAADVAAWLSGPAVGWIGPVWFSAHALLFLGYAVLGLGRALRRLLRRVAGPDARAASPPIARRRAGARPAPVPAAVRRRRRRRAVRHLAVRRPLSYDFRVDEHEIELPHWPRALDGLRVAHLSDIHVGGAHGPPAAAPTWRS